MSPRREEANRQIREGQRRNIAAAASRVFARKGLAAARISDIAAEAGVSQGLVSHYFESKAALFSELALELMEAAVAAPAMAAKQPGTPLQRLRWYLETTLAGMSSNPDSVMLLWQAQWSGGEGDELRKVIARRGKAAISKLAELVSEAQKSGEVAPGDPALVARHLVALLQGLAIQAAGGPVPEGYPSLELVMRVVAPAGQGGRR